jgi:hypothetical protein
MRRPSVPAIRQAILTLAEDFRARVDAVAEGFEFVQLTAHTARVRRRDWLGVCLVTLRTVLLWTVLEIPNQTAATIARALDVLIGTFRDRGLSTVSAVADNARSEIRAVELLSHWHSVFRFPCLSHKANLVIQDFFAAIYPNRNVF